MRATPNNPCSVIKNQDDCLAVNSGTNINFIGNTCSGGHGISIVRVLTPNAYLSNLNILSAGQGSISSDKTVSKVTISGNTIVNSDNALRIKTKAAAAAATDTSVSSIVYIDNTASGIRKYGVIVDQSYPSTLGTPGGGVSISGVNFTGKSTIAVASSATRVVVDCG